MFVRGSRRQPPRASGWTAGASNTKEFKRTRRQVVRRVRRRRSVENANRWGEWRKMWRQVRIYWRWVIARNFRNWVSGR